MAATTIEIVTGVEFNKVAREMRCKWSVDDDKKSLAALQVVLNTHADSLKAVKGCLNVKRIVCGACQDFKIVVTLNASDNGAWEASKFAPEADILAAMGAIAGVSAVETQTYTIMDV